MARTKYTFQKREREKAQRQKQLEKAAQRQTAKKTKTAPEGENQQPDDEMANPDNGDGASHTDVRDPV
jgi:hypothetical protein